MGRMKRCLVTWGNLPMVVDKMIPFAQYQIPRHIQKLLASINKHSGFFKSIWSDHDN